MYYDEFSLCMRICYKSAVCRSVRDITWMSALSMHLAKWISALGQVIESHLVNHILSDFHERHLVKWRTSALSQVVSRTAHGAIVLIKDCLIYRTFFSVTTFHLGLDSLRQCLRDVNLIVPPNMSSSRIQINSCSGAVYNLYFRGGIPSHTQKASNCTK